MAISSLVKFEVRTTGDNDNGGGFKTGASGTDYTLQDAAQLSLTDIACVVDSTTVTSATGGFTDAMVGNLLHVTNGTNVTIGFYEITARTDTNTITVDRTICDGVGNCSATTGKVGGCLAGITDALIEGCAPGNVVYVEAGTYDALTAHVNYERNGTAGYPITIEGYNSSRGDNPTGTNRPLIQCGGYLFDVNDFFIIKNIRFTGTATRIVTTSNNSVMVNLKVDNSSGTAGRDAIRLSDGCAIDCEATSTNGNGIKIYHTNSYLHGCYVHDSVNGIDIDTGSLNVNYCIMDTCEKGINIKAGQDDHRIINNTIYNCSVAGISGNDAEGSIILNNIIDTCLVGITFTADGGNYLDYNNYHGNTGDVTNCTKGDNATAYDPTFTNAAGGNFSLQAGSSCIGAGFAIEKGVS